MMVQERDEIIYYLKSQVREKDGRIKELDEAEVKIHYLQQIIEG